MLEWLEFLSIVASLVSYRVKRTIGELSRVLESLRDSIEEEALSLGFEILLNEGSNTIDEALRELEEKKGEEINHKMLVKLKEILILLKPSLPAPADNLAEDTIKEISKVLEVKDEIPILEETVRVLRGTKGKTLSRLLEEKEAHLKEEKEKLGELLKSLNNKLKLLRASLEGLRVRGFGEYLSKIRELEGEVRELKEKMKHYVAEELRKNREKATGTLEKIFAEVDIEPEKLEASILKKPRKAILELKIGGKRLAKLEMNPLLVPSRLLRFCASCSGRGLPCFADYYSGEEGSPPYITVFCCSVEVAPSGPADESLKEEAEELAENILFYLIKPDKMPGGNPHYTAWVLLSGIAVAELKRRGILEKLVTAGEVDTAKLIREIADTATSTARLLIEKGKEKKGEEILERLIEAVEILV